MSTATTRDEGVIKFTCDWEPGPAPTGDDVATLVASRNALRRAGGIGVYPDGIGFGNVSVRRADGTFVVTGTATGQLAELDAASCTVVLASHPEENRVVCRGPLRASSETMTHAVLYDVGAAIQAVVHVHHGPTWRRLLGAVPTTAADVPYGTVAMTRAVARLFDETDVLGRRVFVMGGHDEGVVTFGPTLSDATEHALRLIGGA